MTQTPTVSAHWQTVYQNKSAEEVSWYQSGDTLSHRLISLYAKKNDPIIDVGSGASRLLRQLIDDGYQDITALDIASAALEVSQTQLGHNAQDIQWVCADICQHSFETTFAIWHDRAVFHFMTTQEQQQQYKQRLIAATEQNSCAIIATFALDGPEKCSNLTVKRHDTNSIMALFHEQFSLVECIQEQHMTPWHSEQAFNYFVLRRR